MVPQWKLQLFHAVFLFLRKGLVCMRKYILIPFLELCLLPGIARAADTGGALNGADITFMAISTLLVLIMTPALAFFYGGLVRRKNYN